MIRSGVLVRGMLVALALLCLTQAAEARRPRDDFAPRGSSSQQRGMSMDEAVAQASRQGRVLSADVVDEGGGPAYRIKVLTPRGRVRVLYFDAGGR